MIDQHKKISGYRDLTQEEIDLMNRIKALGPELESLISDLRSYHEKQLSAVWLKPDYESNEEYKRIMNADPDRWRNVGTQSLQEGLMFLTRSVAQPTFF